MALRTADGSTELDVAAQLAALRKQIDDLVDRGTESATGAAREAGQAALREVDTVLVQARKEPLATALFVLGGAVLGFVLGRAVR